MKERNIMTIEGISCYEKEGTAYLHLETVARGLGFTRTAESGNEVGRWDRVEKHLSELGVPTCGHDGYIPENIFYRLAMRAKNAAAETFQAKIADEVIPSIRRHGAYMTPETLKAALLSPDVMIQLCTALRDERDRRGALEAANAALTVDNEMMRPKADYFDELVDRNLLTNFRDTAKQLHTNQNGFIAFLLERKFLYRDKNGKLLPYQRHVDGGLFELKECVNEKTGWSGTQTLITPKGRETFRLLFIA